MEKKDMDNSQKQENQEKDTKQGENSESQQKGSNFKFRETLKTWWKELKLLARLTEDTDVEATISSIQKAVEFRGVNIWILAFAIIVASVGLNVNSTAVIIGAMLISPLMGPINGIGLSLGISDNELLRKSLQNLLVMVVISLIVSTTYFFLTPLSDAQSELLARTNPTIFDVLIAFFGGLAGIVALSRKDQPFTVISGVAIATALMPPLCTAGFGLATAQWNYFFGAFYLFFINSSFIAIATFTMVRYLHFPQKEYVDPRRRKFVKRVIFIVALIVVVPSVITAFAVVREASFNTQAIKFINDVQESEYFKDVQIVKYDKIYNRKNPSIQMSIIGKALSDSEIENIHALLPAYGLENVKLVIRQTGMEYEVNTPEVIRNMLDKQSEQIAERDSIIKVLKFQIDSLEANDEVVAQLCRELSVQYPALESFAIANTTYYDAASSEKYIVPTLYATWKSKPSETERNKLIKWLKIRLSIEEINYIEN